MSSEPPGGGESGPSRPAVETQLLAKDFRTPEARREIGREDTLTPVPTVNAAAVRELEPGDVVGGYRVEQVIGQGGMGTVYGAVHPLIGKRAAIKVLRRELCASAEAVERFVQEARAVNEIGHPNIVDAFGFGVLPDGRSWCAMEWLVGVSLAERLARRRLNPVEACAILADVIRALEAAHAHGVVHRDLKPDNVFLVEVKDDRARVKLLDFGIAKLTGGRDLRVEKTRTGALVGTPQYIAPEQARGHEVDARTDIYSLGVMTYEMLAGAPPFDADNAADLIAKHLTETPRRLGELAPAIPAVVDETIMAMLEKSPAKRPPLDRVKRVLADLAASPRMPTPAPAPVAKISAPMPDAVRFAPPADDAPLELAVQPGTPTIPRGMPAPKSAAPVAKRGGLGLAIGIGLAIAAAGVAAFVMLNRGDKHATGPGTGTRLGTSTGTGVPATLDVTLVGPPRATISIDGDEHPLYKGAPSTIPLPAGHHEVTVTASGFRTFHTTIDPAAGARLAITARLARSP